VLWRNWHHKRALWAKNPRCGCETKKTFGHLALGNGRAPLEEQGATSSTKRGVLEVEKIIFYVSTCGFVTKVDKLA